MSAVRKRWLRIGHLWCTIMHSDVTWPINGHYRCPRCKRVYDVPWK